jgi:Flp pilus assembly protein TadD
MTAAHTATPTPVTANNLAASMIAVGRHDEARTLLAEHASTADSLPELQANLAFLYLQSGDIAAGREALRRALAEGADPRDPRIAVLQDRLDGSQQVTATPVE